MVQLIKSFSSIDTILDIGCGEGYYSKQIKEVSGDKEIIAFDISKDAVQLAAKVISVILSNGLWEIWKKCP